MLTGAGAINLKMQLVIKKEDEMKKNSKNWISIMLILVLTLTVFTGCGGNGGGGDVGGGDDVSGARGETMVLRFASDTFEGLPSYETNRAIIEEIYRRTDGRIRIDFFPASALGNYITVFEELIIGSIDIGPVFIPAAYDERTAFIYMPAFARDWDEARLVFQNDGWVARTLDGILREHGVVLLGMVMDGFEDVATLAPLDNPFVPGEPKGITMRVGPWEMSRILMDTLGWESITISWGEIPTSLQTGIIDGWMGGHIIYQYSMTGDIINYVYKANLLPSTEPILMSQRTWDRLSLEDQKIFIEVFGEYTTQGLYNAERYEKEFVERLAARGVEVIFATEEERRILADFIREEVWPQYERLFTKEIMDELREELVRLGLE
jgi:TRAP-type C4-dicarboxylate transport system substrate-binding protein